MLDPHPLLNIETARNEAAPVADVASPLLRDLIGVAVAVFGECNRAADETDSAEFPLLASLLHLIEMTDSVDVLIREGCAWPAAILARSAFESLLAIDYIVEADSETRGLCWWVADSHWNLGVFEMVDSSTPAGKQFLRSLSEDKTLSGWGQINEETARRGQNQVRDLLANEKFAPIEEEYQQVKKRLHRTPNWYTLFGGPANLAALAERLNRGSQYALLYRQWSRPVHAAELIRFVGRGDNYGAVRPIRDQTILADVAFHVANFLVDGLGLVWRRYLPADGLSALLPPQLSQRYEQLKSLPATRRTQPAP